MIEYDGKEYWPGLLDRETQPMTEDDTEMFLKCTMMDMHGIPEEEAAEMEQKLEGSLGYNILKERLDAAGCDVSFPARLFVGSMCHTPGEVVMWAYTLNAIRVSEGLEGPITVSKISDHFPWGFPTEAAYDEAWEEQKAPGEPLGNRVDNWKHWPGVKQGEA